MNAYFLRNSCWLKTNSIWKALSLEKPIACKKEQDHGPFVITAVGAGGKTSLIRRLAFEGRSQGLKVLVVTTTHMFRPRQWGVFSLRPEDVASQIEQQGIAVAGKEAKQQKISFVGDDCYCRICPMADLVLVEGDGSKGLPVKVPGPSEPVVPDNSDLILTVLGLSSLGKNAQEACFRLEYAREIMDQYGRKKYRKNEKWILADADLACLMRRGYLEPLRAQFPKIPVIPVLNQADEKEMAERAEGILSLLWGQNPQSEDQGIITGGLQKDESAGIF